MCPAAGCSYDVAYSLPRLHAAGDHVGKKKDKLHSSPATSNDKVESRSPTNGSRAGAIGLDRISAADIRWRNCSAGVLGAREQELVLPIPDVATHVHKVHSGAAREEADPS